MTLRARVVLFSTAQLLVSGALFALVLPAFDRPLLAISGICVAGLAAAIMFSRSLVAPIRAITELSHELTGGARALQRSVALPGELRELRDDLDQLAAELERGEAERRAAAARLEDTQHELRSVSQVAGMAEITTGVLHNVGNVLNSLNVSVATISEQVRGSRVGGLTRSIELADSFPGGLPAFLGTEKGKVLPTYLSSVSKRLSEENAKVLDELASVNRNVDHIKAIVAMQQAYARPSGTMEEVEIAALIDDALHMGEASFARHGIDVIKQYATGVVVVTDRHKLLQILINLISNARHALKDQHTPPQRLIVGVRATSTSVTIAIADTGVGIPAENLDKLFQRGFTTKPGGHGFGLHASANAARELGGTLQAASDGPGRGARFTLELPAAADGGDHDLGN